MTMKKRMFLWLAGMFCGTVLAALPSEITVTVKPSQDVYVEGERMRVVVDIANASPDVIDCRNEKSPDSLVLELYRASDKYQFDKTSNKPFTAGFALLSGEGQKLEAFLADHFLNDIAKENGVTGSRIMGGGFGGCTINLVKEDLYDKFIADAKEKFAAKYGHAPKVYDVVISDGSRKIC